MEGQLGEGRRSRAEKRKGEDRRREKLAGEGNSAMVVVEGIDAPACIWAFFGGNW